jgi:hypothetical protein
MFFGYLFDSDQVEDIQVRICRRFREYETGLLVDGCGERLVVAERQNPALDAESLEIASAELQGLLIGVVRDHDVVAAAHEGENGRRDCAHAGAEHNAVFRAFERGQSPFGHLIGGIAVASVFEPRLSVFCVCLDLLAVFESEGGRLYDGRGNRVRVS